jgi:site-specific DNA-methyltransferase (adenine-specific)
MKKIAGGKQMRSVWMDIDKEESVPDIWTINTPSVEEKHFGKHPTQKPVALLERIILASTNPYDTILDPFTGSSTTGVVAIKHGRKFIGIDSSKEYMDLSTKRIEEITREITFNPKLVEESV